MEDKFQLLLKQQELLIKGHDVDAFAKPYQKNYEEIKEDNRRFKQIKRYQNMLKLHSLMPKMLRKGGESEKATITLHQIDVDKRVQKVLYEFQNESRESKIERVKAFQAKMKSPVLRGSSAEQEVNRLVVHKHDHQSILKHQNYKLQGKSNSRKTAQSLRVGDEQISFENFEHQSSPLIKVNKNLVGATVTFDSTVTNQMKEITGFPNQKELMMKAMQTTFDRKRREELSGTNKTKKSATKQASYLKSLEKENTANKDEKKVTSSENTIENYSNIALNKRPHDKAILVWNRKSKGAFTHNHFVKQKYEELPFGVRKSLEKSITSQDQTRNSQSLNVKVDLGKKYKLNRKIVGQSADYQSNPMNTEKVSPRLTTKDTVRQDIQSFQAQVKRPESAASIQVIFKGQPSYFNDPKRSTVTDYLQPRLQQTQSNSNQIQLNQKYRLSQRLTQSVDRLNKPIGNTVRLRSAFDKQRSSLKVQDSELMSHKGSLMQSLDGSRIPVKQTSSNHLVLKKQFVYNDPQYYRVKFAQPALFKTGCLTCGRENVSVQNYGERYVCTTCQKSLQTPNGESVTLKPSTNSRKIVAQCWKNNVMLKGVKANIDDLRIFGFKCHATFAGEKGELIVLLDEV